MPIPPSDSPVPDSSTNEPRRCAGCGQALQANEPGEVCAACMIQVGFESQPHTESQQNAAQQDSRATSASVEVDQPEELSLRDVQALFPKLQILELIGRGGMGVVYKAEQKHLGRLVALKLLRGKCSQDPSLAERFTREARALAKLAHPHIVGVHDFGQAGDRPYLIMEYIDGTNLRHMLAERKISPQAALAMVSPICDALQFAHEEGIVHRDIKPENILIDRRGRVRIADFGLARLMSRAQNEWTLTGTRQVMGTPHYMAPEQMERPQEVDHRADIFSLGVVIYEMLTGELPIGRFDLPSKKIDIDVRLDRIVLRTLEKEPARRYQHVSDVQTAVEQFSHRTQVPLPDTSFDFTRPAIYIPACGFLIASLIDAIVGIACLFGFMAAAPGNNEEFLAAAHILAALPLGLGGWKMIRGGSRESIWLVAIFGLLPLHIGAWFSIPCSLWTLSMLLRDGTYFRNFRQTSSHSNNDLSAQLEAGRKHLHGLGGTAARHTIKFSQRIVARLGRIAWLRFLSGLAACLAWLTLCGLAALLFLFGLGGYEHFPATIRVVDPSADQVKLKGTDGLYLRIQASGGTDQAVGLTQLPQRELRERVRLSLFRVADKALRIDRTSRLGYSSDFQPATTRNVFSSQEFLAQVTTQDSWEYRVGPLSYGSGVSVEPQLLLADDLESLNLQGMAIHQPPNFSTTLVSLAGSTSYEAMPTLRDSSPLVAWLAATGLEASHCQTFGESLLDTLNRLQAGEGVIQDADKQRRLKPMAALLDLQWFQPQGDQRLQVYFQPQTQAVWLWGAAIVGAGLLGCSTIAWWITRSRGKPPTQA